MDVMFTVVGWEVFYSCFLHGITCTSLVGSFLMWFYMVLYVLLGRTMIFVDFSAPCLVSQPWEDRTWWWMRSKEPPRTYIQLLKKLSQCLAIFKRLSWNKSNKLSNNLKIKYVILHHLGFRKYPRLCDLDQNWCNYKRNKMPYQWDSFLTLYFFHDISFLLT